MHFSLPSPAKNRPIDLLIMHKRKNRQINRLPSSSNHSSGVELTPDDARLLDYELCWCIEELEKLLLINLSDKKRREAETSLKILQNPETPLIRKRQVMRQQFGDYKKKIDSKMKQKKENAGVSETQFKDVVPSAKSVFFKQHKVTNETNHFRSHKDKTFKFNFKVNDDNHLASENQNIEIGQVENYEFGVEVLDNSFRFNF